MAEGRSRAQKKAAALAITAALIDHCDAYAAHVYVVFEDVHLDEWIVGNETITEHRAARLEY